MHPGELNQRVTIQKRTPASPARTATGAASESWTALATVWAKVLPANGRELLQGGQVMSETPARIWIRFRADVTADMRLVHGSTVYAIAGVMNVRTENEFLELVCTAGGARA